MTRRTRSPFFGDDTRPLGKPYDVETSSWTTDNIHPHTVNLNNEEALAIVTGLVRTGKLPLSQLTSLDVVEWDVLAHPAAGIGAESKVASISRKLT